MAHKENKLFIKIHNSTNMNNFLNIMNKYELCNLYIIKNPPNWLSISTKHSQLSIETIAMLLLEENPTIIDATQFYTPKPIKTYNTYNTFV